MKVHTEMYQTNGYFVNNYTLLFFILSLAVLLKTVATLMVPALFSTSFLNLNFAISGVASIGVAFTVFTAPCLTLGSACVYRDTKRDNAMYIYAYIV